MTVNYYDYQLHLLAQVADPRIPVKFKAPLRLTFPLEIMNEENNKVK